jgi:hypothetical protein
MFKMERYTCYALTFYSTIETRENNITSRHAIKRNPLTYYRTKEIKAKKG